MTANSEYIVENKPKLGAGIFLPIDVSHILDLPYSKVRDWIVVWDNKFGLKQTYSFGEKGNKAVDFYTLIEFYVFYQLRLKGISSQKIQNFHHDLAKALKTSYPFAHTKISTDGIGIWYERMGNLVKNDGKFQFDLKQILEPFLSKIEFGRNNIANKYFPLENSKNIVVDPKRQFGQPIVAGTSIKTDIIYSLYEGGESAKDISKLYNIPENKVIDAILYNKKTA